MNVKRMMLLLLIAGIAAAGAFGSGNKEDESEAARPDWRRMPRWDGPELSEETITVTGELYFRNRMHPELESGDEEYELLVPRFYAYELELEEGQIITVEGHTVEGMPCCEEEEEELHIWVTRAVIDGEQYDLEDGPRWGMMGPGMGPRRGMMGPGRRPYGCDRDRDWGKRM